MLRKYDGGELGFEKIRDTKNGEAVVPVIVADFTQLTQNAILMLGFMNRAALEQTIEIGKVTLYSRSTGKLWTKGETSGNFLKLCGVYVDCDNDTLLVSAEPVGPTCHTGIRSCFEDLNQIQEMEIKDENIQQSTTRGLVQTVPAPCTQSS